jgi:hypothetical protein
MRAKCRTPLILLDLIILKIFGVKLISPHYDSYFYILRKVKVNVNMSLCLIKYHAKGNPTQINIKAGIISEFRILVSSNKQFSNHIQSDLH